MIPLHCEYDIPCSLAGALAKQEVLAMDVRENSHFNHVIFAEHPHVYTYVPEKRCGALFRNGGEASLKAPLVPVHRGGSITYHGPGQLVCYFIFDLAKNGTGVLDINGAIEMSIVELLSRFKIRGMSKPAHLPPAAHGVWVEGGDKVMRKIASRGLYVNSRGVTQFGCALNISTDLSWFAPIFPCGLDIEMTSIKNETGQAPDLLDTAYILTSIFSTNLEEFFFK